MSEKSILSCKSDSPGFAHTDKSTHKEKPSRTRLGNQRAKVSSGTPEKDTAGYDDFSTISIAQIAEERCKKHVGHNESGLKEPTLKRRTVKLVTR